jgi:hypothetical protein
MKRSKNSIDSYTPRFSMDFGDAEDRRIHQALRDEYFAKKQSKPRTKKSPPKKG